MSPDISVFTMERATPAALRNSILPRLPDCSPRKILVKPNWVRHQEHPAFPIEALVTSSALIEAVVDACLERYPGAESILVGDVPLQDCDWESLRRAAGIDRLERKVAGRAGPAVSFRDLRRERFTLRNGFLQPVPIGGDAGDPAGYREVELGSGSFLEAITGQRNAFRVSDYDRRITVESHHARRHRYVVAGSALEADLIVNLPKMKTHQKAGITGALKNLVGINGQKGCLVHFREGEPRHGGDEFDPATPWPVRLQSHLKERLQKRSRFLFRLLRPAWLALRRAYRIETVGTSDKLGGRFYRAGGAWYGNDTIWRMIYDLNRIVRYADRHGRMQSTPQRAYVAILDGMTAGEGNGPLQPLPVQTSIVAIAADPFAMDIVMAHLMGYDYRRIPQLAHHRDFGDAAWGAIDPEALNVEWDGKPFTGISALGVLRRFAPPPGWHGHIEMAGTA